MNRAVMASFLGTLAAVLAIVLVVRFAGPLPLSVSQTTTNKASTFDVTGEGEVTAVPDRAEVNVGVQITESTVARAQDRGNQIMNKIREDLKALGIANEDIKTTNYSLYPTMDFRTGSQTITGYSLNVTLQVTVKDFSKINQVVDTATRDGANQVGGVQFTLSEEKRRELEDQVRAQAIERAKQKAASLSNLSGVRLGKIVNITEHVNGGPPGPIPFAREAMSLDARGGGSAAPTNVEPGSTTFRMSVTLSYETL